MNPILTISFLKNCYRIKRKTCTNNTDFEAITVSEVPGHMCFTK